MSSTHTYRVLILGDFYYGESYSRAGARILRDAGYGFSTKYLRAFAEATDSFVLNLDTPLAHAREYPSPLQGRKRYIHWADPDGTGRALAELGVKAVSLGNNHALDLGPEGLNATLENLRSQEIASFGAGATRADAERPFRIALPETVGGGELTFYSAFQYSSTHARDFGTFADDGTPGTAMCARDAVVLPDEHREREDAIQIAFPHWGPSYAWRSTRQQQIAHRMVQDGYDLVLGHGAHAVQEIDCQNDRWILYGIGNGNLQSSVRWEQYTQKNGILPFSFWTVLEVSSEEGGRRVAINLYPVNSNNATTRFQPRPVDLSEFQGIVRNLMDRSGPAAEYFTLAEDDLGHHIRIELADWPVGERPQPLAIAGSALTGAADGAEASSRSDRLAEMINTYESAESAEIIRQHDEYGRHLGVLAISRAAKRQGATLQWLSKRDVWATLSDRRLPIVGHLGTESALGARIVDDKLLSKQLIQDSGVRVPEGRQVRSAEDAVRAQEELGTPIVVKPSNGAMGAGVTVNITDPEDIRQAYQRARQAGRRVMVEQYIKGTEYRAHATSTECVGAFRRLLPNVTGDGTATVRELVERKNELRALNPTVKKYPIPMDDLAATHLQRQGLTWESIVPDGTLVTIRDVNGLTSGGDSEECYDTVPDTLKQAAANAVAAIPGTDWGGVDILLEEDTATPYVMEVNTDASINGSAYPVYGKPRDVGGALWRQMYRHSTAEPTRAPKVPPVLAAPQPISELADEVVVNAVSLESLLKAYLRAQGKRIVSWNPLVWSAESDTEAPLWFNTTLTARDLALHVYPLRRRRPLRRILRTMNIPRPTGRRVASLQELEKFRAQSGGAVALLPMRGSTIRNRPRVIQPADSAPEGIFTSVPALFVQTYRPGHRFRVIATSEEVLAVISLDGQQPPDSQSVARASRRAVQAVRALPQLRWAAVDILYGKNPDTLRTFSLVEDMSFRPAFQAEDALVAGSLQAVYDYLISGASKPLQPEQPVVSRAATARAQAPQTTPASSPPMTLARIRRGVKRRVVRGLRLLR